MKHRSQIQKRGQKIRLVLVQPIYKKVMVRRLLVDGSRYNEERNKLVREARITKWVNYDAIVSVEEYLTTKGTIAKGRSVIFDKYTGKHYVTFHSVEDILSSIEGHHDNVVGFKANPYAHRI